MKARLETDHAADLEDRVGPVVLDDQFVADVQAAAVVGFGVEEVEAILGDSDQTGELQGEVVEFLVVIAVEPVMGEPVSGTSILAISKAAGAFITLAANKNLA